MAWEQKGQRRYFYQSIRVNGKPRRAYFGNGPEAEERARLVAAKKQQRVAERAARSRVAQAEMALEDLSQMVELLTTTVLILAGYHLHHGEWRKWRQFMTPRMAVAPATTANKTTTTPKSKPAARATKAAPPAKPIEATLDSTQARSGGQSSPAATQTRRQPPHSVGKPGIDHQPLQEETSADKQVQEPEANQKLTPTQVLQLLNERANAGCPAALESLRKVLREHPEIWATVGNLASVAQMAWIELISCGNTLSVESAKRHVAHLQKLLAGEIATPLEELLVAHIATTWLAAQHAEITAASSGQASIAEASLRFRRAESALKRHLMAVRTLALVRSMVPTPDQP